MAELIAFFSRKDENYVSGMMKILEIGNTQAAAQMIQSQTGADLFQIEPRIAYSKSYNTCIQQARADQNRNARPELKEYPKSLDSYEVIYLGYPNYWGTMPMAVFTFLERFDFAGKIIKPFCTHEGSGLGSSVRDIQTCCPTAIVEDGIAIHGGSVRQSEEGIIKWIKRKEG